MAARWPRARIGSLTRGWATANCWSCSAAAACSLGGARPALAHAASAALLSYAEHTQGRNLPHIHSLQVQQSDALMRLPSSTRRNFELVQTLRGEDSPTLFSLLDTCMSGMGSRLLKTWLLEPAARPCPGAGAAAGHWRAARRPGGGQQRPWQVLHQHLKGVSDVERITARTALRQVRPRELVALAQTLQKAELLAQTPPTQSPYLIEIFNDLQPPRLRRSAAARPAATSRPPWCAMAA